MTKPDARQTLRPPIPPQSPPTAIKTAGRPQSNTPRPMLEPCSTCRWRVWDGGTHRCHANPPQVRFPYENMACWPVVPEKGGGCGGWGGFL